MKTLCASLAGTVVCIAMITAAATLLGEDSFPVLTKVDAKSIAGRPVAKDKQGKLLSWPMPDNIGYSYSSHVLAQWSILFDQYNRQRYYDFHCCFDFDRTSYETQPDFPLAAATRSRLCGTSTAIHI